MLAATLPFTKGWALCHTPANPKSSSSRSFIVHRRRRRHETRALLFRSMGQVFLGRKISWEMLPRDRDDLILLEGEGGRGGSRSRSRSRGRGSGRGA